MNVMTQHRRDGYMSKLVRAADGLLFPAMAFDALSATLALHTPVQDYPLFGRNVDMQSNCLS